MLRTYIDPTQAPLAKLEANAISGAQDVVIGMASSAPAASIGLTIAPLAAATAYGSGAVIALTAVPMLVIANAYRRLNLWNANTGASFEWVGRAVNPYLGFLAGCLMIAAYVIATVSGVEVLGPSVLAVFGADSASTWANLAIGTGVGVIMLVIAVAGIRITARTQVGMAVIEYAVLLALGIAGLALVLGRHHGTISLSRGWLSPAGTGGKGSAAAGFLVAVFMFTGWDGTVYVNEEVTNRHRNPGRAAIAAVIILGVIYTLCTVGLQGTVPAKALQANSASALVYTARTIGGPGWAKALALALSVIATTGTGIVLGARIVYGMASRHVLPPFLGNVSARFGTPVWASVLVGGSIIALTWVYLLAASVQDAFTDVVDVTGLLFAVFYALTALATITYYRRRVFSSLRDAVMLGVLPLGAVGFLGWVLVRSLGDASWAERWSLAGVVGAGVVVMASVRVLLRPAFFRLARESDASRH
ncbi:MAG TPA: APC family permease [Streptosporangiaceae bacterium]|nr:APC family permease [Streptosporangiaceae bacterium]